MALSSIASAYTYTQSTKTYTLDDYIACQSSTVVCYNNLSFIDTYDGIDYNTYNVISDYVDELRDMCVTVELSKDELEKYRYRPKLLCYYIYGNAELFPIILIINDMYSQKQFTKSKLLMPTKETMTNISKWLYNSNKTAIQEYNNTNKLSS